MFDWKKWVQNVGYTFIIVAAVLLFIVAGQMDFADATMQYYDMSSFWKLAGTSIFFGLAGAGLLYWMSKED